MLLSERKPLSQRIAAAIAAMPVRSSNPKRKRGDTPTNRRRIRDPDDRVPDATTTPQITTPTDEEPPVGAIEDDHDVHYNNVSKNNIVNIDASMAVETDATINENTAIATKDKNAVTIAFTAVSNEGNDQSKENIQERQAPISDPSNAIPLSSVGENDDSGPVPAVPQEATSGLKRKHDSISATGALDETEVVEPSTSTTAVQSASERQSRIRRLLDHRKMLLKRIRQCRVAAMKGLDTGQNENSAEVIKNIISSQEEIEAHIELTKLATSIVRKQQLSSGNSQDYDVQLQDGEESHNKQKLSLSLRKGASVGRRMNAALAELAPGGSSTSAGAVSMHAKAPELVTNNLQTVTVSDLVPAGPLTSAKNLQSTGPSTGKPVSSSVHSGGQTTTFAPVPSLAASSAGVSLAISVGGTSDPSLPQPPSSGVQRPPTSTGYASVGKQAQQPNIKGTKSQSVLAGRPNISGKKSLKGSSIVGRAGSIAVKQSSSPNNATAFQSATQQAARSKKLKEIMQSSSKSFNKGTKQHQPQHQQLQVQKPQHQILKTIFPEAVDLRERRNHIRNKLSILLLERKRHSDLSSGSSVSESPKFSERASSNPLNPSPAHRQQNELWKGPDGPTQLPRKRKTHWDVVLEEMQWMATDYVEERKWKSSTAMVIGADAVRATRELTNNKAIQAIKALTACTPKQTIFDRKGFQGTSDKSKVGVIDDENNDDKFDLSIGAEPAHNNINSSKAKKTQHWPFTEVTSEDEIFAKGVANTISSLISDLIDANTFDVAGWHSSHPNSFALHRLAPILRKCRRSNGSCDDASINEYPSSVSPTESVEIMKAEKSAESVENCMMAVVKEDMYKKANTRVAEVIKNLPEVMLDSTVGDISGLSELEKSHGIVLYKEELLAVDRIESMWNKLRVGSMLHGPVACGKTITMCSLIWRNRLAGPHLLITSSASMIRWIHELSRFSGLRIETDFNKNEFNSKHLTTRDVVLCEYPCLLQIPTDKLASFRCIVVDCRHPAGFAGSRSLSYIEDKKYARMSGAVTLTNKAGPNELSCTEWWNHLVVATSSGSTHRLILNNTGPKVELQFLQGLSNREVLNVLALRIAFLYGASCFRCENYTLQKSVLAWARRRIKDSSESGSKFQRVRNLFSSLVEPLYCTIQSARRLDEAFRNQHVRIPWEIVPCRMVPSQSQAYENACIHVRSALSRSLGKNNDRGDNNLSGAVPQALMHLRRQCTHSNIEKTISTVLSGYRREIQRSSQQQITSYLSVAKDYGSAAQPDLEVARSVLKGSNKMQQLVSILINQCSTTFPGSDIIDALASENEDYSGLLASEVVSRPSRKIVILAALPEVQLLVHILLNALGMSSEIFLRPSGSTSVTCNTSVLNSETAALAWTRMQLALSIFNANEPGVNKTCHIIITSPVSVAGDHGGLGVDLADLIICLDEDWSGRAELIMHALYYRCTSRKGLCQQQQCRFIRLVSEKTCEEIFLSGKNTDKACIVPLSPTAGKWQWPLSMLGFFVVPSPIPTDIAEDVRDYWFRRQPKAEMPTFPGRNIFASRNCNLLGVLAASKPSTQRINNRTSPLFLPFFDGEAKFDDEINIMRGLLEEEEVADLFETKIYLSSHKTSISIVPPLPCDFPVGFVGSLDLPFIPIRLYLEKICEVSTLKEFGIDMKTSALVPPSDLQVADHSGAEDSADEAWQIKPAQKTHELAASLLFYSLPGDRLVSPKMEPDSVNEKSAHGPSFSRVNFFSKSFSTSVMCHTHHDGNQGYEELVYFPPLFPGMLECADIARKSIAELRSRNPQFVGDVISEKNVPFMSDEDVLDKRQRLDGAGYSGTSLDTHFGSPLFAEDIFNRKPFVTEDEASRKDAASVLLDLSDDYGLAGIGAIPLPNDSALAAVVRFTEATHSQRFGSQTNEFYGSAPLCDYEEVESSKRLHTVNVNDSSMILLVSRKRTRGYTGYPASYRTREPHLGLPSGSKCFARAPGGASAKISNAVVEALIQDSVASGKIMKNKIVITKDSQTSSAFNQLATYDGSRSIGQMHGTKDIFMHRILASLRQTSTGATILESGNFRVAATRVSYRVLDRVLRNSWSPGVSFDAGPGVPLACLKQNSAETGYQGMFEVDPNLWTSIVKRLKSKDSVTGGEALELSIAQRSVLRRSIAAPCRVDFGPFQAGFFSSPSGTTAVSGARSRVGVSLPMGVKITQTVKDQSTTPWNSDDVRKLQHLTGRFGMNWTLASRIMTGFEDVVMYSRSESVKRPEQRAARSCREQWQKLSRSIPSFAKDTKNVENFQKEGFIHGPEDVPTDSDAGRRVVTVHEAVKSEQPVSSPCSVEFLLPSQESERFESCFQASQRTDALASTPSHDKNTRLRTFSAFSVAKSKKQHVPITIPGIPTGSPPTVVASHPSHQHAVQSSIAASWSGGRTEMWPLQFLDASDRQKAAPSVQPNTNAVALAGPSSSASSRAGAPLSSSSVASSRPSSTGQLPSQRHISSSIPQSTTNANTMLPSSAGSHLLGGSPTSRATHSRSNYAPSSKQIPSTPVAPSRPFPPNNTKRPP